jgi:hypothetical protein
MTAGRRFLAWGAAALALLAVFLLYLRPVFMVEMAQQLWACF